MAYKIGYTVKHTYSNKQVKQMLANLQDGVMRVGWAKTQKEHNGMKTAEVAYLNETGHYIHHKNGTVTHIVPRPFLSLALEQNTKFWKHTWRNLIRMYFEGKYKNIRSIMSVFCKQYVIEDIRKLVTDEKPFAPNYKTNPKTGKREFLRKTPLIDWGTMIASMTYETKMKGK